MQHANMRRKNESLILSLLQRSPGLSSAVIAREVGLAPQTVSVVLKRLVQQNILVRGPALRGRRGQPAVPISLNADGAFGIGIEIGWRHVDIVLINLKGEILCDKHWDVTGHYGKTLVSDLVAGVEACLSVLDPAKRSRLVGIGIAQPRNMAQMLHIVGGTDADKVRLGAIDIPGELARHFKLPMTLLNDGVAACNGELVFGDHTGVCCQLYLFINTYLGASIVIDGEVLRGYERENSSFGGAMVPDASGNIRALHLIASVKALENIVTAAGKPVVRVRPQEWDWAAIEPELARWLDDAAHGLALAIANGCTVIYFSHAVIDGVLPKPILKRLIEMVTAEIEKLPIVAFGRPKIEIGSLGERAAAVGAAFAPLDQAFFAPEE